MPTPAKFKPGQAVNVPFGSEVRLNGHIVGERDYNPRLKSFYRVRTVCGRNLEVMTRCVREGHVNAKEVA